MHRPVASFASLLVLSACGVGLVDEPPEDVVVRDAACENGGIAVGWPLRAGDYEIDQGNGGAFSHGDDTVNAFAFDCSPSTASAKAATTSTSCPKRT